jgi:hypothetical protein
VLRWPHDHHRDLRTRLDTSPSPNATNRDQDRYLMITIPTSQIQGPHLSRWLSIRHGSVRSNARFPPQLVHRSSSIQTNTYTQSKLIMRGNAVGRCARSRSLSSRASPTALKSP